MYDPYGAWPDDLLTTEDRLRFAGYQEARSFFEGEQWNGRRKPGERRLTFNYARTLLTKVSAYVFPAPVTFSVIGNGNEAGNRAEIALAQAIADNGLTQLDVELCVESSVLGDAAVKVTWDARSGRPLVTPIDPSSLVVATLPGRPREIERVWQASLVATADLARMLPEARLPVDGSRHSWSVVEEWSLDEWSMRIGGETVVRQPNPYGWIPYLLLPNAPDPHAIWGNSDLLDLYDVCRELNARMSVLAKVLEVSGAPITVLENVAGADDIQVGPGARWELPEGARAYLLDLLGGGGIGLHVEYINLLYRSLHDLSETPRTAFGDSGRALSGAALEVEIQPLVQKVNRKRSGWDAFYRQRNRRMLDLLERFGGLDLGGLRSTETIWPGVLPSDTDSAVRNAVSLVGAGIQSRRTAAASLGVIDPEQEMARIREEVR